MICDYYRKGKVTSGIGNLKEAGNLKSVVTEADVDAQKHIIGHLQSIWGNNLRIVGEEDEKDMNASPLTTTTTTTSTTTIHNEDPSTVPLVVPLEEITIFVDPLDGTREFVEGRVENVACLVGIAWRNKSIGGVVGVPFPIHSHNHDIQLH